MVNEWAELWCIKILKRKKLDCSFLKIFLIYWMTFVLSSTRYYKNPGILGLEEIVSKYLFMGDTLLELMKKYR